MQLAILLVLVLIAVLIAPWLIGVIIAAAALYGVWLVLFGALVVVAVGVSAGLPAVKRVISKHRMNQAIEQVNRKYREEQSRGPM